MKWNNISTTVKGAIIGFGIVFTVPLIFELIRIIITISRYGFFISQFIAILINIVIAIVFGAIPGAIIGFFISDTAQKINRTLRIIYIIINIVLMIVIAVYFIYFFLFPSTVRINTVISSQEDLSEYYIVMNEGTSYGQTLIADNISVLNKGLDQTRKGGCGEMFIVPKTVDKTQIFKKNNSSLTTNINEDIEHKLVISELCVRDAVPQYKGITNITKTYIISITKPTIIEEINERNFKQHIVLAALCAFLVALWILIYLQIKGFH